MEGEFWSAEEYDAEIQRLYDREEYDRAVRAARRALELYPNSVDLRVSLGYTELAREEYAWARRAFEAALALEAEHEEALVGLSDALLKLGERSRALLILERVVRMGHGGDPELMLAAGRALYREELYERAERFYRMAVRAEPGSAEALAELGYTLYQRGDTAGALRCLKRAVEGAEEFHEARVFYGNLLYDGGDYRGALSQFERVPAPEMWDSLAVWRTLELMRGFRRLGAGSPRVEPYVEQLERLHRDPPPEERLLAELASSGSEGEAAGRDGNQLDLFAHEPEEAKETEPSAVHTVRARNGRVYTGDWLAIVRAMRDDSANPALSVREFMREGARFVHHLTGLVVPEDDPEAFIRASARAGILRIEG